MSEINDYLSQKVADYGIAPVAREVKQFLKLCNNRRVNIKPTKRKAVPRSWTISALKNQNYICSRCSEELTEKTAVGDHFVPLIQGGEHNRANIVAVSKRCNSQKGGRDINQDIKFTGQTILERLPKSVDIDN